MPARIPRPAAAALLLAAATACADADAPSAPDLRGRQLVAGAGVATVSHAVRGVVVGVDSAQGVEAYAPIAGASVRVVRLTRPPVAPGADTAGVAATRIEVGAVTTDAAGAFQLAPVAEGYFALEVTPPAGSPYGPGTAYSVSLAPADPGRALVYLYRR